MLFSQRIGKAPATKNIQIESIDDDLKVGLWNVYSSLVQNIFTIRIDGTKSILDHYFDYLWAEFFKFPIDTRSISYDDDFLIIRKNYYNFEWHKLYDFIEFNASLEIQRIANVNVASFRHECNRVLEREFSGYRLIDGKVVAISNVMEVREINEALKIGTQSFHSQYYGVNIHLQKALDKLSDKKNPDYSNSIKESISSIEAICRILTNETTLGEALKSLDKKGVILSPQLRAGIEKIYAYTNNKDTGIRHAIVENPNLPSFDDAKFVLVVSSALANFLISKTS
jgi:hypothetical protein